MKDIDLSSPSGATRSIQSSYSVTFVLGGAVTVEKEFDHVFSKDADTYQYKGKSKYVANPSTGDLAISSEISYLKNGSDIGSYTISSSDLHASFCGLDKGSIELKNASHHYVLTISGCGQHTLTDNGTAIPLN
ncbi:MAG: hypothetical protein HC902_13120 [Calothrix sp. SM1_5_4]|nr:hypothetical protein [Calothrix sp. SM1_5_4]